MRTPEQSPSDQNNQEMDETNIFKQAIESFEEKQSPLSEDLDRFISYIAKTGDILGPWEKVQKVFMNKLELTLDEFYKATPYKAGQVNANCINDDFDEMKKRLLQLAEEFDSPPFTIQRLCELLCDPRKNYTKCDKFMRGIEKNLMVVSSWNYLPRRSYEANDRVNGTITTSNGYVPNSDRFKPHWSSLPPSPISTTPPVIPGAPDFTMSAPKVEGGASQNQQNKEEIKTEAAVNETSKCSEQEVKDQSSNKEGQSKDEGSSEPLQPVVADSPGTKRRLEEEHKDEELGEEASPTKKMKQDDEEDVQNSDVKIEEPSKEENSAAVESSPEKVNSEKSEEVKDDLAKSPEAIDESAKIVDNNDIEKPSQCETGESAKTDVENKDDSANMAEEKDESANIKDDSAILSKDRTAVESDNADEPSQMEVD